MKTTRPSEADGFPSPTLMAANEPSMPEAARTDSAPDVAAPRGWDPYDVWRTRVKASRENGKPVI